MDYAAIEPFGEYRHELRHGQMMSLHANVNRDTKKRSEPYKASDFMNFTEKPPEKKYTDAELEAEAARIFGA